MILDSESVYGNGKLLGVNVCKFFLSAAVFIKFVQHILSDHFGTVTTQLFHPFSVWIEFENAWQRGGAGQGGEANYR